MNILLQTMVVIFAIVVLAEFLWRTKLLESEYSRKLVHILVGTFAATWAFFLNDQEIYFLTAAMFLVVLGSRFIGIFASIHSVKRKTWGELFFPLGIAAAAALTNSPWIFLAAVLHVSLADALAALIGRKYVKKYGYKIFNQQKTLVGTLIFFISSLVILLTVMVLGSDLSVYFMAVLIVPVFASLAENIGAYGSDDLLVPIVVTFLLANL